MTAWIITKDKIAEEADKLAHPDGGSNFYAVNMIGPRIASDKDKARLLAGEGRKFRMKDDDGEIYYYGRQLLESDCTEEYESGMWGQDSELAPLDNFGAPNAGCTQIEVYNKDKKEWEGLL